MVDVVIPALAGVAGIIRKAATNAVAKIFSTRSEKT